MNGRTQLRQPSIPVLLSLLAVVVFCGCTYTQVATEPPPEVYDQPVEETDPYDYGPPPDAVGGPFGDLSYYGDWLVVEPLGWVWRPRVVYNWQPFHYGHWEYTNWGWTWFSYEPFGWAVYHYGYWWYHTTLGWIWLPGHQWFPNRVTWIVYGDYVCWAPVPPPGYYIGDPWSVHVDVIWVVVHGDNFTQRDIGRYTERKFRPWGQSAPGGSVIRRAPEVGHIEKRLRKTIAPVEVRMDKFTRGGKEYQRMELPPEQKKTVDRHREQTEKKTLREGTDRKKTGTDPAKPKSTDETKKPGKRGSSKPESKKKRG